MTIEEAHIGVTTTTGIDWIRPPGLGELEALAAEIRFHLAQAELHERLAWEHRFALGERIHTAKMLLRPGELYAWVERETGLSERHARRLLLLWRERTRVAEIVTSDPEASLRAVLTLLRGAEDEADDEREPPELRPTSLFDKDPQALGSILAIHARPAGNNPRAIDVTYGRGHLWRGLRHQYHPTRSDADPALHAQGLTDVCAEWSSLPFDDGAFDILVFDPPHVTDAGAASIMGARYSSLKGTSIAAAFQPMLLEARRVLQPATGLLVAKLANQVHNSRYQDQARTFANTAESLGFEKVDEAICTSSGPTGRWETVEHLRRAHTFWLALRAPKAAA